MKLIDLHKQTATVSSAATINLGAAVSGFRTIAQAIAADASDALGIKVGDKGLPFIVRDPASGAFEFGYYTLTSAAVLTREKVVSSTNGNNAVAFGGVSCEVYSSANSAIYRKYEQSTSARVVYTSSVCVSDTDLTLASNTSGADQRAKLQSLLDLAADGPLTVIWDGAYTVGMSSPTTSLRIRSNTRVIAMPGCGAKFLPETPVAMWRNYNPTVVPGDIVDTNIEIHGGIWHGNSANQSVRETAANGGTSIMDFVGVRKLRIVGPHELRRARGFAWRGTNVYNVDIEDGTVEYEAGQSVVSTDGYHLNGPARYINIRNVRLLNCADDAIAFNADDAWVAAQAAGTAGPYVSWGEISDVLVDGVFLQGNVCGIRMLSGASRMDRFIFQNIQGKTSGYWLIINSHVPADTTQSGPGNVGSVVVKNVNMENTVPVGGWFQAQAHVNCKVEQFIFENVIKSKFNNVKYPALVFGSSADVGQAHIKGYKSRSYNGGTYLTEQVTVANGGKVGTLRFSDCDFYAGAAVSGSPVNIEAGATVGQLIGLGNGGMNFASFVNNQGTVTNNHFPENTLNFMDSGAASTWQLSPGFTEVSASALTFQGPLTAVETARKVAKDPYGGNGEWSGNFKFTGDGSVALHGSLFARGSNTFPWNSSNCSAYVLDLDKVTDTFTLQRSVSGTDTKLGQIAVSGGVTMDALYKGWIKTSGSAISAKVQRASDSLYLQANGTWAATEVYCMSATDTGIPAAAGGYEYGVYGYAYTGGSNTASGVQYTNLAMAAV